MVGLREPGSDGGFIDRLDAGHRLAPLLEAYRNGDAVILGMARGGVPVAHALARELHLPLRALVVRKLGAPPNPELAIGAVSETGVRWLDPDLVLATGASQDYIDRITAQEVAEAQRRQQEYAVSPGLGIVRGRPAIVVDDGIATGASALVAARSAHDLGASEVVLAAPVASRPAVEMLRPSVDRLVVLRVPDPFYAVGLYYQKFDQVSDDEVIRYLRQANRSLEDTP